MLKVALKYLLLRNHPPSQPRSLVLLHVLEPLSELLFDKESGCSYVSKNFVSTSMT